jgi:hypothetical protein
MNKRTIWDWVYAINCGSLKSYIEYNQAEPTDKVFMPKEISENETMLTNQRTPEKLTVKRDLYDKLCEDSRWLLVTICSGEIDPKMKKKGIQKFLIKNGWNHHRIRLTFKELEVFMSDIKEVSDDNR